MESDSTVRAPSISNLLLRDTRHVRATGRIWLAHKGKCRNDAEAVVAQSRHKGREFSHPAGGGLGSHLSSVRADSSGKVQAHRVGEPYVGAASAPCRNRGDRLRRHPCPWHAPLPLYWTAADPSRPCADRCRDQSNARRSLAERLPTGADSSLALRSAHGPSRRLANSPPISNPRESQIPDSI